MDAEARRVVDDQWCTRFELTINELRRGGVRFVMDNDGANDAMSFRLGALCVVVVRSDDLATARDLARGRDVDEVFTADYLQLALGPHARVDGPSWHGYVTARTFRGTPDPCVVPLAPGDAGLVSLRRRCSPAEWGESGFPRDPAAVDPRTTRFYGLAEHGELVAAGNMTDWRGLPADVGVLTRPDARRRGLAGGVAATMTADALPEVGVVRYRALVTNLASLAVARRLGFEPYGQNYRARRNSP